jgi:hypothetical protein
MVWHRTALKTWLQGVPAADDAVVGSGEDVVADGAGDAVGVAGDPGTWLHPVTSTDTVSATRSGIERLMTPSWPTWRAAMWITHDGSRSIEDGNPMLGFAERYHGRPRGFICVGTDDIWSA